MPPDGNSRKTSGVTLPSLVKQLRASCQTIARFQGGSAHYLEQLSIFRDCARTKGFLLDDAQAPSELISRSQPDTVGGLKTESLSYITYNSPSAAEWALRGNQAPIRA